MINKVAVVFSPNESEFRTQKHLMEAEGTTDTEPSKEEVFNYVKSCGYYADAINVWYDTMQHTWRWSCNIIESIREGFIDVAEYGYSLALPKIEKMESKIEELESKIEKMTAYINNTNSPYDNVVIKNQEILIAELKKEIEKLSFQ